MNTLETKSSCSIKIEPKFEGKIKQVVRRIRETVQPVKASVRWDKSLGAWAVLDKEMTPVRHFYYGIMTNVKFESQTVRSGSGCGTRSTTVGVATGMLVSNTYGTDMTGFHNLSFDGDQFIGESGQPLREASVLRLMSDRRSMYK